MPSRFWPRSYALALGAAAMAGARRRRAPAEVRRLLIVHNLLLGDTVMLTPLIKKARTRFPKAEIVFACPPAFLPMYQRAPYGITPVPLDPRSLRDHAGIRGRGPFDLAVLPADNRWSWLARAAGARWIVAFSPGKRGYKEWPVDELRPMPEVPTAWGDMAAGLIDGADSEPYSPEEWPAPDFAPYQRPRPGYCVLHLGASRVHKLWPSERWIAIRDWAEAQGVEVVLSAGRGERQLLAPVDPDGRRSSLAGQLDLAQLWDLLRHAAFLVCPDTGIAHLGRLVGVPTVALYGPGSPIATGPGAFWARSLFSGLWDPDVACRDQDDLFGRRLVWLRKCGRGLDECADPFCIRRVGIAQVTSAIEGLLTRT